MSTEPSLTAPATAVQTHRCCWSAAREDYCNSNDQLQSKVSIDTIRNQEGFLCKSNQWLFPIRSRLKLYGLPAIKIGRDWIGLSRVVFYHSSTPIPTSPPLDVWEQMGTPCTLSLSIYPADRRHLWEELSLK